MAISDLYGKDIRYCSNRKEVKEMCIRDRLEETLTREEEFRLRALLAAL